MGSLTEITMAFPMGSSTATTGFITATDRPIGSQTEERRSVGSNVAILERASHCMCNNCVRYEAVCERVTFTCVRVISDYSVLFSCLSGRWD